MTEQQPAPRPRAELVYLRAQAHARIARKKVEINALEASVAPESAIMTLEDELDVLKMEAANIDEEIAARNLQDRGSSPHPTPTLHPLSKRDPRADYDPRRGRYVQLVALEIAERYGEDVAFDIIERAYEIFNKSQRIFKK